MLGISSGRSRSSEAHKTPSNSEFEVAPSLLRALTSCSCGDSDESTLTTTHRHIAIPVSLPISPSPAHYGSPATSRTTPKYRPRLRQQTEISYDSAPPHHRSTNSSRTPILTPPCSKHGKGTTERSFGRAQAPQHPS